MNFRDPFLVTGLVMALVFIVVLGISFTENRMEGKVKITPTYAGTVHLGKLEEGRTIEGEYRSDADIHVYILTLNEAETFRNPSYYDDFQLPIAVSEGRNGTFSERVGTTDTYEILFWNESFNGNHQVSYSISTGMRILRPPFMTSVICLALLSAFLLGASYVRSRKRDRTGDGPVRRR